MTPPATRAQFSEAVAGAPDPIQGLQRVPSQSWPRNYTGAVTGTGIPSEQGPDVSRIAARAFHGPANDRLAALGAEGEWVGRRRNDDDRRGLAAGDAGRQELELDTDPSGAG